MATLPPEVESLAWLLGTWTGDGRGGYPSIDDFTYAEQTTFGCEGKPRVDYLQRTRLPSGVAGHSEGGFLRTRGPRVVEAVIAQGGGVVEIGEGMVVGTRLELTSTHLASTPSAKDVRAIHRVLWLDDDVLRVHIEMEAVGHPLGFHLEAALTRID